MSSTKFWAGSAIVLAALVGLAFSGINEYVFFAGFVVLQFVVLASAWNILGGYAGYVNFGVPAFVALGAYSALVCFKALGAPLLVQILAGAVLIVVGPVDPALDRLYIGRTFCVVVLAGLGSMSGTLAAGLILGITESIVLMVLGTSWAPAVSFGLLLLVLGIRPQGLFGR